MSGRESVAFTDEFPDQNRGSAAACNPNRGNQLLAVDRNEPVFDVKTMEQRLTDSLAPARFHLLLIGAFAAIAMVLAAVGVY
jgi:hypothetical protein